MPKADGDLQQGRPRWWWTLCVVRSPGIGGHWWIIVGGGGGPPLGVGVRRSMSDTTPTRVLTHSRQNVFALILCFDWKLIVSKVDHRGL